MASSTGIATGSESEVGLGQLIRFRVVATGAQISGLGFQESGVIAAVDLMTGETPVLQGLVTMFAKEFFLLVAGKTHLARAGGQ